MRTATFHRALRALVFVAAWAGASAARGQSAITPEDLRRDLIGLADKALGRSDPNEACQLFQAALQIRASARLAREVAKCEETLGHYEPAMRMATQCRDDADKDKNDPDPAATRSDCSALVSNMARHFGTLTVKWPADVKSPGTLFIDAREVENRTEPQRLLPGTHAVRAIVPGRVAFEQRVSIEAAKDTSVMIEAKVETGQPRESEVPRSVQSGTGLRADIGVGVSTGFGAREMNGSGKVSLGPLFVFDVTLPGVGFGERDQLRPYAMYRHEALERPVDGPTTARGLEIEHVGGGLLFLHTKVRDDTGANVGFRAALGGSASHLRSGNWEGAYGGVFLGGDQKTGLYGEGWGFSFPEVTLGLNWPLPVDGKFALGIRLSLQTGLGVWDARTFNISRSGIFCYDAQKSICPTSQAESFFGSLQIGLDFQHSRVPKR